MSVTYVGIILALWVFIAALLFVKGAFWLISLGSILIFLTSFREFWRMLQSQFGTKTISTQHTSTSKILLAVLLLSVASSFILVFRLTGLSFSKLFS